MYFANKTNKGGTITYHYSYSDLRRFIQHGRSEGNNGWILTKSEGGFQIYRGYGTIEAPSKYLSTISVQDSPSFDSVYPGSPSHTSHKMVIWDPSDI